MAFAKCFLVLTAVAAVANALATPGAVRHGGAHHRALAARVAAPAPVAIPGQVIRKRANSKRCRQRSSAVPVPSSTSPAVSSPAPENAAPIPTLASSSAAPPPPVSSSPPAPETTKKASSTRVATTPAPAPTTSTPAPAPSTSKAPSNSGGSSNLPSFLVGTQTGQGTFYATGLGACGITNTDSDHIAAVSHLLFDNFPGYNGVNPNSNPMCGRSVTATYQGKSVVVKLTDRCTGCALTDLDFSPSAFNILADPSIGRISGMTWVWND